MLDRVASRRFRTTADLFDLGIRIARANLRRRDPATSDEELERRLAEWVRLRPGAEDGDAPGQVRDLS